jgi:hypothetical protein
MQYLAIRLVIRIPGTCGTLRERGYLKACASSAAFSRHRIAEKPLFREDHFSEGRAL